MSVTPVIEFTIWHEWYKKAGEGRKCFACKEPAYGNIYILTTCADKWRQHTDLKLCESCYTAIMPPTTD